MIFVPAAPPFGGELADKFSLKIIIRQNQTFRLVADGERDVLQPNIFLAALALGFGVGVAL